ncbi:MAG: gamma-glutamyltransferase [Acidobacteriota bacterium]|nr:gamma-glutamyltransferase [Acidobacteriota bacterium]
MSVSLREQVPLPSRSQVQGNHGAVTAMTSGAARAGAGILAAGGNAADAAVAAMLAAGVVEPAMNGLAGTAYAVVFEPASGRVTALDGSARCPARAHEAMFEPLEGVGGGLYGFPPTRGDRAETGPLSVLAPTAPATLVELHRRFGRLPFAAVVEPAVQLAEEGFVPDLVFVVHAAAGYRRLRLSPAAFALYTRGDGVPFVPGGEEDRLRNPELAESLRILGEEGPEPFYQGPIARRLLEAVNEAGGVLSESDLAAATVREVPPLDFGFRDLTVATLPDNSGGPTLAAALAHLDAFPPAGPLDGEVADEVRFLHLAAESLRLAFLDRFAYLGDPESVPVPLPGLLDPDYLRERRQGVTPDGSRRDAPNEPLPPGAEEGAGAPQPGGPSSDCTTHVNAMDADGMAVGLTGTLGGRFGSAFAVPGLGYPLNNGMMWFDPRPGRRISPAPGRRALHAAAPAILLRDGVPWAVVGSPGGRRLISAVAMGVARLVDRGASMQDAAGGPGFHADAGPLTLDERTPDCGSVARGLEGHGHQVLVRRETALTGHFGRASGIRISEAGGGIRFEPGVDPVRAGTGVAVETD